MSNPGIFGRMTQSPNSLLSELLYEPGLREDVEHVLPFLLKIDAAHVVMLTRQKLLPRSLSAALLALNADLSQRLSAGEEIFSQKPTSHRGLYMLYENEFVERLGPEIGGAAHLARSRNDINATITRMRLRSDLLEILSDLEALQSEMLSKANSYSKSLMSGFTHLQPSQPTSFGHYLAAVLEEVARSSEWLSSAYEDVNCSPMGAAAGLGSGVNTDPALVARFLGFSSVAGNTLNAVASRDYIARVLSYLSILGTTLSRLTSDLQMWGSGAYKFVDWTDDVMSTSSIMPQKRNAFVLENIRAQSAVPTGALVSVLTVLKASPFSNSAEVSSGTALQTWPALAAMRSAVRLMTLLLNKITVNGENMRNFMMNKGTEMTALAEFLVAQHGLAFRTAHDLVSDLVSKGERQIEQTDRDWVYLHLNELIARKAIETRGTLRKEDIQRVLDPYGCLERYAQSNSPAPSSLMHHLKEIDSRKDSLRKIIEIRHAHLRRANTELDEAVLAIRENAR
ncbi:MAG: Argininosuccinate lyase 1 [Syntrophorhabdus sp. PtaU1.Bin002]|nr:MAG: Argininosuccinate lyase 1 [Syntrophorhabdus sp. PtaU1.Bin002]